MHVLTVLTTNQTNHFSNRKTEQSVLRLVPPWTYAVCMVCMRNVVQCPFFPVFTEAFPVIHMPFHVHVTCIMGFSSHFIGKFYPPVSVPDLTVYTYGENYICNDDVI